MSANAERRFTQSQQERQAKYDKLLLAIVDRRHTIEEQLEQSATSIQHSYAGFYVEAYEPPEFLDAYIMPFESVTIDIDAHTSSDGTNEITSVILYPSDHQAVSLKLSGDIATLECGDELTIIDAENLIEALRQSVPYPFCAEATTDQLITFAEVSSPETSKTLEHTTTHKDSMRRIRFTKVETVDDSLESLEVTSLSSHPSDAYVGTHMTFTEALSRRQQAPDSDMIHHRLTVDAIHADENSETIFDVEQFNPEDKSVEVTVPVQRHLQEIVDTLKEIR